MRYVLAVLASILFVGCGGDENNTCSATTAVSITDYKFAPSCITVAPGAVVTFTNNGHTSHTSSTDNGQSQTWDSGTIAPNGTFDVAVTGMGAIKGHCNFHPSMLFTIQVQATAP